MNIQKLRSKQNKSANRFLRILSILLLSTSLWTISSASFAMEEEKTEKSWERVSRKLLERKPSLKDDPKILKYRDDIIDSVSLQDPIKCKLINIKSDSKYIFKVKWEGKTHCIKYLDLSRESNERRQKFFHEVERNSIARKDVREIYEKEAKKLVLLPSHHTVTIDPEHHFMVMEWAKGRSLSRLVDYQELNDLESTLNNVGYAIGELHYLPLSHENDDLFAGYGFKTHTHRDLTFPNIYHNIEDGKTYLIDFESYSKNGSSLFDLNFFLSCLSEHCKDEENETVHRLRVGFMKGYAEAFKHLSLEQKKKSCA
jgi:tRNA A-37 threonylcarbamoyl transferase component Bud32